MSTFSRDNKTFTWPFSHVLPCLKASKVRAWITFRIDCSQIPIYNMYGALRARSVSERISIYTVWRGRREVGLIKKNKKKTNTRPHLHNLMSICACVSPAFIWCFPIIQITRVFLLRGKMLSLKLWEPLKQTWPGQPKMTFPVDLSHRTLLPSSECWSNCWLVQTCSAVTDCCNLVKVAHSIFFFQSNMLWSFGK